MGLKGIRKYQELHLRALEYRKKVGVVEKSYLFYKFATSVETFNPAEIHC